MVQQGYSLLRIIIIDSFWKGQVNELDLTGHTQLEGTNGAGKTSLMRLLPLFYGMRPSDIVSKVDQARNFADYYLPRDSSMLVYEYQRPHGQTCMVLASSDGRGVHFKFIDGAYNSDHFIGEDNKPYSVSEVDRFYRQMGCDRSSFLGIDKYRQVIQNLRSGRKLKDIRQLQNRYAFSELPCPHIEKVINGTIEKNLDFEAVKRMLVAIASDHLARNNVEEKEQISLNKEEITSWLADIQASRAVQKVADKIDLWQSDFATLDSLLIKLQHLHFEIIEHQVKLEEKQKACSKAKQDSQLKLSELQNQLEDAVTSFNQQIYDFEAEIRRDQSEIDLLDDDKMIFDDDDAPNYQLHADKAPHIQNELNEVNAIIDAFEGDLAKVQQKFTDLIQKLEFQHVKDQADNEKKSADISAASATQLGKVEAIYQQQNRELEKQISQKNLDLKLKTQNVEHELHSAKVALNHVQLDPILLQDIEQNQAALSDAKDKQNQLYQSQVESQSLLSSIRQQRDKHLDKHRQESRQLEALKAEYTQVEAQLIPPSGSLQYYLDNEPQASDWKHNIGRLLTSEQLTRCDLDPQWVGGDSFYGLTLDLQQLQSNDSLFLDEMQLREKRDVITKNIQIQTDKLEQLDEHINDLSKEITAAESGCTRESQNLQKNTLNLQQLNVQLENLVVKKQLSIRAYAEEVNVRIRSLESDEKDNIKLQQLFNDNCEEQRNELHNQVLEKRMVVESDRDSQLTLLSQEHIELNVNYLQRLKALNKQQHVDVAKLDPDGEVDKRMGERKNLATALQKCTEFEQKAHKYHHFMTNRYCHRNGLVEQN
ncbi:ATP-binding protein, partial [bacterium]|nr:ATP-binding protein [bacterium]